MQKYLDFAKSRYVKNGQQTGEDLNLKLAVERGEDNVTILTLR